MAGGHGDVSVRLWCEHGVPCTVIEPRAVGLRRRQRKQVKRKGLDGVARLTCEMQVGRRFRSGEEGEGGESEEQARLREALEGCALIIGMHPDEATDAIVDVAHEYAKPFACVPVRGWVRVVGLIGWLVGGMGVIASMSINNIVLPRFTTHTNNTVLRLLPQLPPPPHARGGGRRDVRAARGLSARQALRRGPGRAAGLPALPRPEPGAVLAAGGASGWGAGSERSPVGDEW